jgi:uncharacterized membrane protein required for colicin V production
MEFNVIDIVVVVFILLVLGNGFRKGLIMSLFDLVGLIASFFIAWKYHYIVRDFFIERTGIVNFINDNISTKISNIIGDLPSKELDLGSIFKGFEKLPSDIQRIMENFMQTSIGETAEVYAQSMSDKITNVFLIIISFTVAFLMAYLILMIVAGVLNVLFKAPVLNTANKLLGGLFGLLKAVVLLYIVFAIASPFIAISEKDNIITTEILESKSSEVFYENNLILNYLTYKGILAE